MSISFFTITSLLTLGVVGITASPSYAASPTGVNLAGAANFAVLAKTYVTTGATSTINGDIGAGAAITTGATSTHEGSLYAGAAITTGAGNSINGSLYAVAAITNGASTKIEGSQKSSQPGVSPLFSSAMSAMDAAIADASARTSTEISSELGGTTLLAGVYSGAPAGFLTLTGTITLDARNDSNAVFIIKSPTYLAAAASSRVTLVNGAKASNVFWLTGGYVSLGANASIAGNILASSYVSLGADASVQGRIFSQTGYILFGTSGPGSSFGLAGIGTTVIPPGGTGTGGTGTGTGTGTGAGTGTSSGLIPILTTPTPTPEGVRFLISNYDPTYTWTGAVTNGGLVGISATGVVTVSGLPSGTPFTATIMASKPGLISGIKSVSGNSANSGTASGVIATNVTIQASPVGADTTPAVETVQGQTVDARLLASVNPPSYNKFEYYNATGILTDAQGRPLGGAEVTLSGQRLLFSTGSLHSSTRQNFAVGSISTLTSATGAYSVEVRSNVSGEHTLIARSGAAIGAQVIKFDEASDKAGTELKIETPDSATGTAFSVSVSLKDPFGNKVHAAAAGKFSIKYVGPGVASRIPVETDANGLANFTVFLSPTDKGIGTITATYDGDANTATLQDNIVVTRTIYIGQAAPALQQISVGSFKGYVAIYALGYQGQRLTAKIGNDWVIVPAIPAAPDNLYRWVEPVGFGVDCVVRIFIDRVLVKTVNLTTK
ncbi:ice-binding family protein [Candidatus Aquiluna sp. UB-MaderosW2red]|uniref:ice-binding family protein n=1 Tax=Candidatus Aquiluna sp. UB-MaderosW2red TaxID=1855377 RepID=UPI000B881E5C|nr:ice-binding family protein [Candidatus Aquiluna sp. UB-MaderosW2red]